MIITLMRHGEAQSRAETDASRPLTERGRKDNHATAMALLSHKPQFSHALRSPYLRAQQTADDLCAVLGSMEFESSELLTPDTPVQTTLVYLQQLAEQQRLQSLLLVGHNPLLSRLLCLLLDGSQDGMRHLDTSNLVCLNVEPLAAGCADIEYWLRADS